jgi:hypothetical protein
MLKSFEEQLRTKLENQSCKLSPADLYSHLMTEWVNPPSSTPQQSSSPESEDSEDSYEVLERQKERLQQLCDKFESVVFEPLETDEVEIDNYIQDLFSGEEGTKALKSLRQTVKNYGNTMLADTSPFDQDSLLVHQRTPRRRSTQRRKTKRPAGLPRERISPRGDCRCAQHEIRRSEELELGS